MKQKTMHALRALLTTSLVLLAIVIACNKQQGIYQKEIGQADYDFLTTELRNFNIPVDYADSREISYKLVAGHQEGKSIKYIVYVLDINEQDLRLILDTVNYSRTLIRSPLSDNIMFNLKIGDKKQFDILELQSPQPDAPIYTVDRLKDHSFSSERIYFHFQDLTVYEDESKQDMRERRKKFILLELDKKRILYYNSSYDYNS